MKIAILSDAHLFHRNSQIQVYKDLVLKLQEEVDMIVDCGDLIDKNIINATQAEELKNVFNSISIPFHIVKGNHDALGGVSLATLLAMNNNIIVHNNIDIIQFKDKKLLFIPYIDKIKDIFDNLKNLNLQEQADYAFSHLSITNNFYATISFDKINNLYNYASIFFNGHIHMPEKTSDIFGTFYNVGSISSLTYGDEHIPCYSILDTKDNTLNTYAISKSIIHKTINVKEENTDDFFDHIDNIIHNNKYSAMRINWRINLPSDFDVDKRQKIKQYLQSLNITKNVQFNYTQSKIKNSEDRIDKTSQNNYNIKLSMMQQLLQSYEKDNKCLVSVDIKNKLEV